MNGVQTRLKCKPNVKRCKRFVFAAHSPLLHPNTLKTKAIIHFQTDHILTRFVFPPLYQKEMRGLTREAKAKLLRYSWPGNVRELQHTMERAVILGDGSLLRPDNFLFQASSPRLKKEEEILNLEQLERQAVEKAMRLSEGNMTRAAEYLGITRFALYRKIEKLGL